MKTTVDRLRDLADGIGPRRSGSGKEAAAAAYVRKALEEMGLKAKEEPFSAPSRAAWFMAPIYILPGLALWLTAVSPGAAVLAAIAALVLFELELNGAGPLSSLAPGAESRNVWAELPRTGRKEAKIRVAIVANLDSGPSGPFFLPFGGKAAQACAASAFVSFFAVVAAALLASFKPSSIPAIRLAFSPFAAWLAFLGAALVLRDLFGGSSRGANDNASGLAVLLEAARRIAETPLKYTQIEVLATGAKKPGHRGMLRFMKANRFHKDDIILIVVDRVGSGTLFLSESEGLLVPRPTFKLLSLMAAEREGGGPPALRLRSDYTDAAFPVKRGLRAVTLTAGDASGRIGGPRTDGASVVREGALDEAVEVLMHLLRKIDERWK